jgi:hypothetical protein
MIPELGLYKKATSSSANTEDIIKSLAAAVPGAVDQIKPIVRKLIRVTGDPVKDARSIAKWVNQNITYVKDDLQEQKIRFPSNLLNERIGDCKSFSLLVAAALKALGYKAGFRFAAYRKPNFTHVYNFVLDNTGKKHTFDACIESLRESPTATKIKDMFVSYVAEPDFINGKRKDKRRAKRAGRKANKKEAGKGYGRKRVALAPVRNAFLVLLKVNFRGSAAKLAQARAKDPAKVRAFWLKLGGDPNKFNTAIDQGKGKKALFGQKKASISYYEDEMYIQGLGEPVAAGLAGAIAAAAPVLIALPKLLKSLGVGSTDAIDEQADESLDVAEPLGDFESTDAETPEAREVTKQTPTASSIPGGFNIQSLLLPGALVTGLYFLSK